jgi:hypothetical protein
MEYESIISHEDTRTIDQLSDLELLQLAARGQESLTEGTIASPLLYRLLGKHGLLGSEL